MNRGKRGLLSPGFACLPDGTRMWHYGDQADCVLQAQAQGAETRGLPVGHNPTPPLQASGQPCLDGLWHLCTITPMAIAHAAPERQPGLATHPKAAKHLCEIVPPIFAMPIG